MMKPYCFAVSVILVMTLLFSCAKEPAPAPVPDVLTPTVGVLKVPAGFGWQTTSDITCRINAAVQTRICVALTADGEPFADFTAAPDAEPVVLNVPKATQTVYLKYETAGGLSAAQAVSLTGNSLDWTVPSAAQAASVTRSGAVTRAQEGIINYPASRWGTLLFEDLWPSYGDFDFNDMVVDYAIRLYPNNKNMVKRMQVVVRMRAVGGSLPYDLHLALMTIKAGEVDNIEMIELLNAKGQVSMELLNAGNSVQNAPVFRFNGMKNNANRLPGAAYLNTERGYEMDDKDLVEAIFEVTFRNSIKIAQLPFDAFDFFIARSDVQKEIHRGGEVPLLYGQLNYHTLRQACPVTDKNAEFFYSNDNLVWALSIPQTIPHAFEKTDFVSAYPNFAKWVESGGVTDQDWYANKNGNRVESNLVAPGRY